MIRITDKKNEKFFIEFMMEEDPRIRGYKHDIEKVFHGKYLECFYVPMIQQGALLIGCGKDKDLGTLEVKELFAKAAAMMKQYGITAGSIDISAFVQQFSEDILYQISMGLQLGTYEYQLDKKSYKEKDIYEYQLCGVANKERAAKICEECEKLVNGIYFARDMVNLPGNKLRPMDFSRAIADYLANTSIQVETLVYGQLKALGLQALAGIGGSSEYPPCLMILRYKGDPKSKEIIGLIGKGVTCDTGGYCLKTRKSMYGIKQDMAGAAAVTAVMHTLSEQNLKINVTACLPLCENRISQSALLPGDVITGYSGKTIEILNTDAEGRLVLSDAVSYGIKEEGITKVLDIATLTGAVVTTLGTTIAGAMSDDDAFYNMFESALAYSDERYLRFPFGKAHEHMIDSQIADVKNIGEDNCGTITGGLFIRRFAEGKPWIHLDIAGTAASDSGKLAFEAKGGTGAGTASIYYMLKGMQNLN